MFQSRGRESRARTWEWPGVCRAGKGDDRRSLLMDRTKKGWRRERDEWGPGHVRGWSLSMAELLGAPCQSPTRCHVECYRRLLCGVWVPPGPAELGLEDLGFPDCISLPL